MATCKTCSFWTEWWCRVKGQCNKIGKMCFFDDTCAEYKER